MSRSIKKLLKCSQGERQRGWGREREGETRLNLGYVSGTRKGDVRDAHARESIGSGERTRGAKNISGLKKHDSGKAITQQDQGKLGDLVKRIFFWKC